MTTDLQLKINADYRLKSFIREYPIWYKRLNRNPDLYKEFVMDMKDKYKLNTSDKLNNVLSRIGMFQSVLEILK